MSSAVLSANAHIIDWRSWPQNRSAAKVSTLRDSLSPQHLKPVEPLGSTKFITIEIAIEPCSRSARNEYSVAKSNAIHPWPATIQATVSRVMTVNKPATLPA